MTQEEKDFLTLCNTDVFQNVDYDGKILKFFVDDGGDSYNATYPNPSLELLNYVFSHKSNI